MSEHLGGQDAAGGSTRPHPGSRETEWVTAPSAQRLADHWGLVLTYGIFTFVLGVILAVWPGETVQVVAFLLAFQLLILGSTKLFMALVSPVRGGLGRLAGALTGAVAVVAGALFLVSPLQTLTFVCFVAGAWLVLAGVADLAGGFMTDSSEPRAWEFLRGALSVIIGAVLIVNPKSSLSLLVVVVCVWLLAYGFMTILSALELRRTELT
jgi:uncharacterized membrane protein HdeD (DUF308 family)